MLLVVLVAAVVTIALAVPAFGPVPRRYVERFLRRYPIRVTVTSGPMVIRRLARVRAARTIGGFSGAVGGIVAGLLGLRLNLILTIAIGYLLGAIVAEAPSRRYRTTTQHPAASLVPRQLRDYVPRWIVVAPAFVIAVTLVIDAAGAVGARRPNVGYDPTWRFAFGAAFMLVAFAVTLVTARMILHRPQPYTNAEMVSADDALRAASMHCVSGGGFAVIALLASSSLANVATLSDVQLLRWIAPWLDFVFAGAALFAWFGLRVAPWLVRRPYALGTSAP